MNETLRRFGYPSTVIHEYEHWAVLIRPKQVTMGCAIIAAKSSGLSLGDLTIAEGAELPSVVRDYERAIRKLAAASKFNYLALMMVDPNPHLHAIPRYSISVVLDELVFEDASFPQPPDLRFGLDLDVSRLDRLRNRISDVW